MTQSVAVPEPDPVVSVVEVAPTDPAPAPTPDPPVPTPEPPASLDSLLADVKAKETGLEAAKAASASADAALFEASAAATAAQHVAHDAHEALVASVAAMEAALDALKLPESASPKAQRSPRAAGLFLFQRRTWRPAAS